MIRLNLINPKEKQVVIKEQYILIAKNIISLFLILIVCSGILVLLARTQLDVKYRNIIVQSHLVNMQNKWIDREIKNINNDLKNLQDIQKNFVKWSAVMSDIFKLIPYNNQIYYIKIDNDSGKVEIRGNSLTREDFLKLKANLENSLLLSEIESPLTNLLNPKDVDFTFNGKIVLPNK